MSKNQPVNRRKVMKILASIGLGSYAGISLAGTSIGAMIPGKGWVKSSGQKCEGDSTPLQFIPKTAPDDNPLDNELSKYPKCPYCGMSRKKWHHSRHLVHYDDGLVDGTCSIHCLSISLSLNIDRGTKAIYAADFGSSAKMKPLVNVDKAHYLIGSKLKATMSKQSRMAFSSFDSAKSAQASNGGEIGDFNDALKQAYLGMATDTIMIRKRRAERRKKMMKMKMKMKNKS